MEHPDKSRSCRQLGTPLGARRRSETTQCCVIPCCGFGRLDGRGGWPQAHTSPSLPRPSGRATGRLRGLGDAGVVLRDPGRASRGASRGRSVRRLAHGRDPDRRSRGRGVRRFAHTQPRARPLPRPRAVQRAPHRARHLRRRPAGVPSRSGDHPAGRQRLQHREGSRLDPGARDRRRHHRRRLGRDRAARAPGSSVVRDTRRRHRSRARQAAFLSPGVDHGRRRAGGGLTHRLHRRGRLRDLRRRRGRRSACGTPCSTPDASAGSFPPGWVRATACASRPGSVSTATRSTRRSPRSRWAWTGW